MRRRSFAVPALLLFSALVSAQDAPPQERTLEVRLHALSRGYMRPMLTTTERVMALPGLAKVEALGFAGDVLRYRVITLLDDAAIAAVFGLEKVGASGGNLLLAADPGSRRAQRAEARAVMLDIARVINTRPKPDWRRQSKPIFAEARTFSEQMKTLGLDPAIANGTFYKAADYHIEEQNEYWAPMYRIWVGKKFTPTVRTDDEGMWGDMGGAEDEEKPKQDDPRFVGLVVNRNFMSDTTTWVDAEGARMNSYEGDRSETDGSGKLKVQAGAEWLEKIMRRAVAHRLQKEKPALKDLPAGRGWSLFSQLQADDLQRWEYRGYNTQCVNLKWDNTGKDKHFVARLSAFYEGHPFYLLAEVDADAVLEAYKKCGDKTAEVKDADLGEALKWIVGPESGPEVFAERRKEAHAAMDALLAALGKLPAEKPVAGFFGKLTDDKATELGVTLTGKHFKAADYELSRQAFGDVEIAVGSAMTGGHWWLLGSPKSGTVIRSDR